MIRDDIALIIVSAAQNDMHKKSLVCNRKKAWILFYYIH